MTKNGKDVQQGVMTSYGIKIKTEKKLLRSTLLQSHPAKAPFT